MPAAVNVKTNIANVLRGLDGYKRDVVDQAVPRALNRTVDMARTAASRELRADGYNFTASEIKQAISVLKASRGRLVATMRVRRRVKSLMDYSPRQSRDGVSVKIHGGRKTIKGAFIAQRLNGQAGVYIEDKKAGKITLRFAKHYKRGSRGGWHSYPARKLFGPSVGGAYATARVQQIMLRLIAATFEDRLAHEITYLSRR